MDDSFTSSVPYTEKHVKISMNRNPAGVYFVEDRIESNGFRVAGYLGLANTARLRLLIEKVKPVLEQWASIREGFENFPSYAGADLFD